MGFGALPAGAGASLLSFSLDDTVCAVSGRCCRLGCVVAGFPTPLEPPVVAPVRGAATSPVARRDANDVLAAGTRAFLLSAVLLARTCACCGDSGALGGDACIVEPNTAA